MGLEATEPLRLAKEFVFLCHTPCVTLSEERLTELRPWGNAGEPPKPWWLGAPLFFPGPWLALKARREPRFRSKPPSIGAQRLRRTLETRVEAGVLGLGLIPLSEGSREHTRWV
jgi:hypothetical protein